MTDPKNHPEENLDYLVKDYKEVSRKRRRLMFRIYKRKFRMILENHRKAILTTCMIFGIIGILSFLAFTKKVVFVDNSTHTVVYTDTVNTFHNYCWQLQKIESNFNYKARREYIILDHNSKGCDTIKIYSQYCGAYQLGKNERYMFGFRNDDDYLNSIEQQERSIILWLKFLKKNLQPYINKYDGKWVGRYYITESGILGMAHLCGIEATKKFLDSKGEEKNIPIDGNGVRATDYLLLLDRYNLDLDNK